MKTRNKLLTLLILSAGAATATALINKAIKISATSKNVLSDPESLCYKWRFIIQKRELENLSCWFMT